MIQNPAAMLPHMLGGSCRATAYLGADIESADDSGRPLPGRLLARRAGVDRPALSQVPPFAFIQALQHSLMPESPPADVSGTQAAPAQGPSQQDLPNLSVRPESGASHRSAPERPLGRTHVARPRPIQPAVSGLHAASVADPLASSALLMSAAVESPPTPDRPALPTIALSSPEQHAGPVTSPPLERSDSVPGRPPLSAEFGPPLPPPARAEGSISDQSVRPAAGGTVAGDPATGRPAIPMPSARAHPSPALEPQLDGPYRPPSAGTPLRGADHAPQPLLEETDAAAGPSRQPSGREQAVAERGDPIGAHRLQVTTPPKPAPQAEGEALAVSARQEAPDPGEVEVRGTVARQRQPASPGPHRPDLSAEHVARPLPSASPGPRLTPHDSSRPQVGPALHRSATAAPEPPRPAGPGAGEPAAIGPRTTIASPAMASSPSLPARAADNPVHTSPPMEETALAQAVAPADTARTRPREPLPPAALRPVALALGRGDSPPPTPSRHLVRGDETTLARQSGIGALPDPSAAHGPAASLLRQLTTPPGPDAATSRPSIILDTVHQTALLDQIAAGTSAASGKHAFPLSRVTISLRPPDLGTIHIAVDSRATAGGPVTGDPRPPTGPGPGDLSAHFHATQPAVHAWLQSNASLLRSHLSDAGLHFQDLTFSTTAHHQSNQSAQDQPHHRDFLPPPPPTLAAHGPIAHGPAVHGPAVGWFA